MTKKNESKKGSSTGKVEFKGFFNPYISRELKTSVKALDLEGRQVLDRLGALLQDGFKFSIVSDATGQHYTFSLFDKREDSNSAGYVLSIKHSSLEKGITALFILHDEIYERGGWLKWIEGRDEVDW